MSGFLERYLAGEHEQVWDDLVALGPAIREEPVYTDALAVTHETMRRVRYNIELLISRLSSLGYQFGYRWAVDQGDLSVEEAREMERHEPLLSAPPSAIERLINEVERRAGLLPLSLRAFYEVVGGVNFVGSHSAWGAYGLDALVVESAAQIVDLDDWMRWSDDKDARGTCKLPIAPDEHHKYFVSGNVYTIRMPAVAADAPLEGERHDTTFVNYLRVCFKWGGFPGLECKAQRPEKELAFLTHGLMPI